MVAAGAIGQGVLHKFVQHFAALRAKRSVTAVTLDSLSADCVTVDSSLTRSLYQGEVTVDFEVIATSQSHPLFSNAKIVKYS